MPVVPKLSSPSSFCFDRGTLLCALVPGPSSGRDAGLARTIVPCTRYAQAGLAAVPTAGCFHSRATPHQHSQGHGPGEDRCWWQVAVPASVSAEPDPSLRRDQLLLEVTWSTAACGTWNKVPISSLIFLVPRSLATPLALLLRRWNDRELVQCPIVIRFSDSYVIIFVIT